MSDRRSEVMPSRARGQTRYRRKNDSGFAGIVAAKVRWSRGLLAALAVLSLSGSAALGRAQEGDARGDAAMRADAFVQSGGVSLGSYGAGFAYYYTLARKLGTSGKDRKRVAPFRVVTGASAGSINALLAALAGCMKPELEPSQSMFFRTWVDVGMQSHESGKATISGLADPSAVTSRSLFSRAPIDRVVKDVVQARFEDESAWEESCEVLLGLVATRRRPNSVPLQVGAPNGGHTPRVLRQTEKFVFILERKAGRTTFIPWTALLGAHGTAAPHPLLKHPPDASVHDLFPVLGTSPHGPISFEQVILLLKASAAFPFAFPPVRVPTVSYCPSTGNWGCEATCGCTREPDEEALGAFSTPEYYDGGLFENVPLRLAGRVRDWLGDPVDMVPNAAMSAKPRSAGGRDLSIPVVVMDYDAEGWQRASKPPSDDSDNLLPTALRLLGNQFGASLGSEYFSGFEADERSRKHAENKVLFPVRGLPPASNHLSNFLGFFERDFRVFDFFLGMLDAWRFTNVDISGTGEGFRKFECLRTWYEKSDEFEHWPAEGSVDSCALQGAGRWSGSRWEDAADYDAHSQVQSENRNFVRLIAASQAYRRRTVTEPTKSGFAEAEDWFADMDDHGVRYTELGVSEASEARAEIRDQLSPLLRRLPRKQEGFGNKLILWLALPVVANSIEYREPFLAVGVEVSPVSAFGLSAGMRAGTNFVRLELAHRFYDIDLRRPDVRWSMMERGRVVFPLGAVLPAWFSVEPFGQLGLTHSYTSGANYQKRGMNFGGGLYAVALQRLFVSLAFAWNVTLDRDADYREDLWNRHRWAFTGDLGWRFFVP